mmetsp:Transcript_117900/g.338102  ORF Transcript_117900/g.338102 Transcript_117900/m.338102 type:complete len:231 (-) Transcript_117900:1373-2065(-)
MHSHGTRPSRRRNWRPSGFRTPSCGWRRSSLRATTWTETHASRALQSSGPLPTPAAAAARTSPSLCTQRSGAVVSENDSANSASNWPMCEATAVCAPRASFRRTSLPCECCRRRASRSHARCRGPSTTRSMARWTPTSCMPALSQRCRRHNGHPGPPPRSRRPRRAKRPPARLCSSATRRPPPRPPLAPAARAVAPQQRVPTAVSCSRCAKRSTSNPTWAACLAGAAPVA